MKDQMQYIVIEGRKPQDGAKPAQALLILPKWISPTLACAGIVGRVIELTDGNVIEQGPLPSGEQEVLANIREEMQLDTESQLETDDRHEQELQAEGVTAPVASDLTDEAIDALAESMPGGVLGFMKDWGYRQFAREVQAFCSRSPDEFHYSQQWELLNSLTEQFGRPVGAACLEWLRVELTDLERGRNAPLPAKLNALLLEFGGKPGGEGYDFLRGELEELAAFRESRPEILAKLQAAEDNLDAWRDAAGAAGLGQECDEKSGQIKRLFVEAPDTRDASDDVRILQEEIDDLERQVERQAKRLHKIAKHAKKALQ